MSEWVRLILAILNVFAIAYLAWKLRQAYQRLNKMYFENAFLRHQLRDITEGKDGTDW